MGDSSVPLSFAPPEIYKPSKISEALREVGFNELLKVAPEAFFISGPRHPPFLKSFKNP
tara:strand:- start:372 stop:548 length:177 start_codon:yes stop_codon:yes gene_type:complete